MAFWISGKSQYLFVFSISWKIQNLSLEFQERLGMWFEFQENPICIFLEGKFSFAFQKKKKKSNHTMDLRVTGSVPTERHELNEIVVVIQGSLCQSNYFKTLWTILNYNWNFTVSNITFIHNAALNINNNNNNNNNNNGEVADLIKKVDINRLDGA